MGYATVLGNYKVILELLGEIEMFLGMRQRIKLTVMIASTITYSN